MLQTTLPHTAIRGFVGALALQVRVDVNSSRDINVDRPKREAGGTPPLANRIPADGARFVPNRSQPQQDQQEGNASNWACSIYKSVLDIGTGKECDEGGRFEDTVDRISATADLGVSPTVVQLT